MLYEIWELFILKKRLVALFKFIGLWGAIQFIGWHNQFLAMLIGCVNQ